MSDSDALTTWRIEQPRALDPVNAYAVISLVAALLGLFPIAIVFGILAFTRPAGRGIAIAGLVIGVLELAALLVVFIGFASAITNDSSTTAITVTSSVNVPLAPTEETSTEAPTQQRTPTDTDDTTEQATTEEAPESSAGPVVDATCSQSQASAIATDANTGQNIVCTFLGADGGYKWVQSGEISPGLHERGDACNPATDKGGRSVGGGALVCVSDNDDSDSGSWEPGP